MKKSNKHREFYIVVNVWRGFAVGAEMFQRKANAIRRFNKLLEGNDLRENDVQLFKTTLIPRRSCRSEQMVI